MLLGIDVGGTFTDAVLVAGDRVVTAKAPTTPDDESEGVIAAVDAVLARAGTSAQAVRHAAHGMTVATNALLEGRGARTALIATEGFVDVAELGRQARADLYRLCARHPDPIVPPERRIAAPERMAPDGAVRALTEAAAAAVAESAAAVEPEAVAVVLLHAYRHPSHELALGAALAARLPGVHVSLSHETVGTFREFERAATTEVDATLSPLLARYLRRLLERTDERGLPRPAIMQSSGGLADVEVAARHAVLTVLSGPAGGAAAAALVARSSGLADLVCFDMGGTSCDVCVVSGGRVGETDSREVGGRPLSLPAVDIHTVGAGGGSVAWRDAGGALRVGPRSAGARPGPACYGRGGEQPTVTDANLLLGYLPADEPLAGGVRLDRAAAAGAVERLADELGLDLGECARGIVRVANAEMARALRVMTVERGVDPRGHALLAFGGAGPMHACAIAEELAMRRIAIARGAGVLSALGLAAAERRRDVQRSVLRSGESLTSEAIAADVQALAQEARAALGEPDAPLRCVSALRYRGQAFELSVEHSPAPAVEELREAFAAAHEQRYGYADADGDVELVTLRVSAHATRPEVTLSFAGGEAPGRSRRAAYFGREAVQAEVLRGDLPPGTPLEGPAVCELPEATLVVAPGWSGEAGSDGTIVLERRFP